MLVVEVVDKIVEKEEDKWPVLIYGVMFRDIFFKPHEVSTPKQKPSDYPHHTLTKIGA